jgi:hypothetical protein
VQFIKEDRLYNWRTDDIAGLCIPGTSKDPEPPQHFFCTVIGHTGIVSGEKMRVPASNLLFLGAGERTGKTHQFAVYEDACAAAQHDVVILQSDGGSICAYVDMTPAASEMWRHICKSCSLEILWNMCSGVVRSHELGRQLGRQEIMDAYAEGRLRRKKGRFGVQVCIKTKILEQLPVHSREGKILLP